MGFIEFPIRRYQFTVVAFLLLVALGISSFNNIPRSEDPYFPISTFVITVVLPGADPKELERSVVKPIEDALSELEDLKTIDSTVNDSVAVVIPEFEAFVDVERKYDEVVREINALRPKLPAELQDIRIRKVNPGLVNIVQMALVSEDAPYAELEEWAKELKDRFKGVTGVRQVETWAYPERELRVALDLERMARLGVLPGQLMAALASENANIPAGVVDVGSRSFSLRTTGSYERLDQVRDTVVTAVDGQRIRVRDLAEVSWSTAKHSYLGRYDGKRAVFITANQQDGHSIFDTRDRLHAVANEMTAELPPRIVLELGFDQAVNVAHRLARLGLDFAIAITLVLITLLPLGFRASVVVMVAIPLSLAMGVAALHALGQSLNQLSIAGFVVALGLLVDDSIVVVENIARHLRAGMDRTRAAIEGTKQIFQAVLGCTAVLLLAFLPLLALPGNAGKFIRVLPTSVVVTVVASLVVALTIVPFLASRLLEREPDEHGNWFLRKLTAAISGVYRPLLHRALARPGLTVVMALGLFVASLGLVPVMGFSLFPKADTPQFLLTIETPEGSSLAATDHALRFVEDKLAERPEVAHWFANLGHGNPKIYYNIIPKEEASNLAELFVQLHRYHPKRTPLMLEELRADLADYPNARIVVKEFENGPPIAAPIAVRVLGPDLDTLRRLTTTVEQLVREHPGTRDIDNPVKVARTDLKLVVDSEKANLLGVAAVELDRAVRLAISGLPAGSFRDDRGESYTITVRAPMEGRPTLALLDQVQVPTRQGTLLPLSQLARLEFSASPTQIQRVDRERAVVIKAFTRTDYNTARVTTEIDRQLASLNWPRGYRYEMAGEAESRAESFQGLGAAALVAVFGILAVLVLEFGSFKSTLIVLGVVPLGVVGGLVMLFLTGYNLSFTAMIGFIALVGIEIKNSILLVDFTNQLRAQGRPLDEAIEEAGEVRFLPILLTSATAIGGLLPLALQNVGMYSPMAWVIIGGLISSTLLARLVTPVMYKLLPPDVELEATATVEDGKGLALQPG